MEQSLAIEQELAVLLEDGHSRTRATELVIERFLTAAADASSVVLVEGVSDAIALEVIAVRVGRMLRDEGVAIVPMGGATNIGRFLSLFVSSDRDVRLAGLYDVDQEDHVMRKLDQAGVGRGGFYACDRDLEDELLRRLPPGRIEGIMEREGDLKSFRTMQNEPHHRQRPYDQQIHRFVGRWRYRYARLLASEVDLARIPLPLSALLADV
jgi:hypothetical protein